MAGTQFALKENSDGSVVLAGPDLASLDPRPFFSDTLTKSLGRLPFEVALLSAEEANPLPSEKLQKAFVVDTTRVYSLLITPPSQSADQEASTPFIIIVWAAGQQLRKRLGLKPRHFSVTSIPIPPGLTDVADITPLLTNRLSSLTCEVLDHLAFTLHLFGDYEAALPVCIRLCQTTPDSHRGYLRMADAASQAGQHKPAMLGYARAFEHADDPKVEDYCLKKIQECSQETEWGHLFRDFELSQVPSEIKSSLLIAWSPKLTSRLPDLPHSPSLCIQSREALFTPFNSTMYRLPRWFRWLVPHYLAIMSTPKSEDDIRVLSSMGIRHVVTLTEEEPLPQVWFKGTFVTNTFLPIPNYRSPSTEQMDIFLQLLQDEEKVPLLFHCGGGKGRAGTVAACFLVAFGFNRARSYQEHPTISAKSAISALRLLRPGSLETTEQEAFVTKWESTIWKRQSVYPDLMPDAPPCPLEIEGQVSSSSNLFILVGLPGAGKSWLSRALIVRDQSSWTHICQDETGSRSMCETQIGRIPNGRVLLDRCNSSASERKQWLNLTSNWVDDPVCIWLDYSRDICLSRAQSRIGHPTLQPGNRVTTAVDQMHKLFIKPTIQEGFKTIYVVRSFAAADELIARLSPPVALLKYPRTPHLLNLGAVGPDDIIGDLPVLKTSDHVVITEKVDGANMGFSLSHDRSQIVTQNRSHYVVPNSHEQFKKLGLWIDEHRKDLYRVLDRDPHFPQRYILYGEWLYATHSIAYTNLPDRFLAFDIYDRATGTFADRKTLTGILAGTTIYMTPVLHEGEMLSGYELTKMVQGKSHFYEGRMEGAYVHIERNGIIINRGKVVRGDFLAGNEHWSKATLQVNGLALENGY